MLELVLECVSLPDLLDVEVKLGLTLPVSDTDELLVSVCVELKLVCSVLDVVPDTELVPELVPDKELVALQLKLLEKLRDRLTVAVERVPVSLPLTLPDSDRDPEGVELGLSDTEDDKVDVPDADSVALRLPERVMEGLLLKLRLREELGVAERLPEALPVTEALLEHDFVPLAESVLVHVPEPGAEDDCVQEGLVVALGLRDCDLVQLLLCDGECEPDKVEVADPELLEVSENVSLPDLDCEALEKDAVRDREVVAEGDALSV